MNPSEVIKLAHKDGIDAPAIGARLNDGSVENAFFAMVAEADRSSRPVSMETANGIADVVSRMWLREVMRLQLEPAIARITARAANQPAA